MDIVASEQTLPPGTAMEFLSRATRDVAEVLSSTYVTLDGLYHRIHAEETEKL